MSKDRWISNTASVVYYNKSRPWTQLYCKRLNRSNITVLINALIVINSHCLVRKKAFLEMIMTIFPILKTQYLYLAHKITETQNLANVRIPSLSRETIRNLRKKTNNLRKLWIKWKRNTNWIYWLTKLMTKMNTPKSYIVH